MPQWTIPDLYCPFAPAVNERAREAEEETAAWLSRYGLADDRPARAVAAAAARLAARIRPQADYTSLSATADFYAWMFIRDDYCDETVAGRSAFGLFQADLGSLAVLEGRIPGSPPGGREQALADVVARMSVLSGGRAWRRGLRRQMRAYFQATFWEAANRARGEVPDLATYSRLRPLTAGIRVDDVLLGASLPGSSGAGLPPHPTVDPLIATLAGHSERAVCWSNDLLSLEKELAAGDIHNLIVVLCREQGLTTAQAISRAAWMHDGEVRSFIGLEERILARHSGTTAAPAWLPLYMEALKHRMRGNLDWSLAAARYGVSAPDGGTGNDTRR